MTKKEMIIDQFTKPDKYVVTFVQLKYKCRNAKLRNRRSIITGHKSLAASL